MQNDMRDRLIKLLQSVPADYEGSWGIGNIADHLIANGVIPVVRCRDFKHYDGDFCNNNQRWNDDGFVAVTDDDFCSYGEKK